MLFSYVWYVSVISPSFEFILIYHDFLDVFSIAIPSLSPERDIEFAIDLEPSTRPIFMALYDMAFVKLKEINTH